MPCGPGGIFTILISRSLVTRKFRFSHCFPVPWWQSDVCYFHNLFEFLISALDFILHLPIISANVRIQLSQAIWFTAWNSQNLFLWKLVATRGILVANYWTPNSSTETTSSSLSMTVKLSLPWTHYAVCEKSLKMISQNQQEKKKNMHLNCSYFCFGEIG